MCKTACRVSGLILVILAFQTISPLDVAVSSHLLVSEFPKQLPKGTGQMETDFSDDLMKKIRDALKKLYGTIPSDITVVGSEPGDVATGIVVQEAQGELFLDKKPCIGDIVSFQEPYRKIVVGKQSCKGKSHEKVQVEQL